jgi:hypothetical protein
MQDIPTIQQIPPEANDVTASNMLFIGATVYDKKLHSFDSLDR